MSDDNSQKSSIPSATEVQSWVTLIEYLINALKGPRARRYAKLTVLNDVIEDVRTTYEKMFIALYEALPDTDDKFSNVRTRTLGAKAVFLEARKTTLRADRGVWKDKVAGWLQVSNDPHELRYLFTVFWFMEYRDDWRKSSVPDNEWIDREIRDIVERGGSRKFDSPSAAFALEMADLTDPREVKEKARTMQDHIGKVYAQVVRRYQELGEAWGM